MTGMKFLIATVHLLYCCFVVCPAMATSIVAVRVNDRLIVGADSKETRADNLPVTERFCKIGRASGFYFVTAGFVRVLNSEFDAHTIITNASRIAGKIEGKITAVEQAVTGPLIRALTRHRQRYPLDYRQRFKTGSALQIIFFGVEAGSTFMITSEFISTPPDLEHIQLKINRSKCPGECPDGDDIFAGGENDAFEKFLNDKPNYWKINPIEAVRTLIELEIKNSPNLVGPPVDILYVDKNGAQWIQRKKECPDM
jgi:hypothetical protein